MHISFDKQVKEKGYVECLRPNVKLHSGRKIIVFERNSYGPEMILLHVKWVNKLNNPMEWILQERKGNN